jgi:hypothetical protein
MGKKAIFSVSHLNGSDFPTGAVSIVPSSSCLIKISWVSWGSSERSFIIASMSRGSRGLLAWILFHGTTKDG